MSYEEEVQEAYNSLVDSNSQDAQVHAQLAVAAVLKELLDYVKVKLG